MTRSKKITIALLFPALLAGLIYCLYLLADAGMLGKDVGMIVFIPTMFLFFEHLLIGSFLYNIGIGSKVVLPAAGLNEEYPLGWFLAVLINYLILSALAYSILSVIGRLKGQNKEK